jgi:hypothetical protein
MSLGQYSTASLPFGNVMDTNWSSYISVILHEELSQLLSIVYLNGTAWDLVWYSALRNCSVAFLPRSGVVEGPIAAFGCSDGVIRVLSMTLWQVLTFSILPCNLTLSAAYFLYLLSNSCYFFLQQSHLKRCSFLRIGDWCLWQLVRRYISGHKGPVSCLLTFQASSGEVFNLIYFVKTKSCFKIHGFRGVSFLGNAHNILYS